MSGNYPFRYIDSNLGPVMVRGKGINRVFKKADKVLNGITKSLNNLGKVKEELMKLRGGCTRGNGYQIGFGFNYKKKINMKRANFKRINLKGSY